VEAQSPVTTPVRKVWLVKKMMARHQDQTMNSMARVLQ
jgi:hypothetical protein